MGYVDVAHVSVLLPDGRILLDDVNFRVGEGTEAALVGANGTGETTLMRVVAGDLTPTSGGVAGSGGLGVMRQFIGSVRDSTTVREFLLGLAPKPLRDAGEELEAAEWALAEVEDEPTQLRYAAALAAWGDAGGYDAEVRWDTVTVAALGVPYEKAQHRTVRTLSGGEQTRLALETLLRGPDEVLLLDEATDNLDLVSAEALLQALAAYEGTVLAVTHDRWFARTFDRFLVFRADGAVVESDEPVWDAARVDRVR